MELPREVFDRAGASRIFQEALDVLRAAESDFDTFRIALSADQQKLLDRYLNACEDVDTLLAQIGYQLGYEQGKRDSVSQACGEK